jgi:hypothetical protein
MSKKTIDYGKLDSSITFRIPGHAKALFHKLPIERKHEAEHRLRIVIARAIHDSKFDPDIYLGDEEV